MQLEPGDLGRPAGRDVHARVEHAVQRHALQAAQRVQEARADHHAAQRIARALGRAVQTRVCDAEPGQEGAGVVQRLDAQQRVEVDRALVRLAQIGRQRAGAEALVAQLLRDAVALGARLVGVRDRLAQAGTHVAQLLLAAVELAGRALRGDAVAGEEDRSVSVEPQRPRSLGALGRIGERDDDAPLGDVEPHDARGEDVVTLGLERGRAVRQRHEGIRAGQQLHLVAVVAAAPHAHAHDIAGAGLLGDRGDLVGLERL